MQRDRETTVFFIGELTVLLNPGTTCWRVERANRLSLITDMSEYFAAAKAVMSSARRSIHLLNWAFDPDTFFLPNMSGGGPPDDRFGPFLRDLACANKDLDVRILCWRSALPVAATQNFFPHRAKACFEGTPVRFRLDSALPMGACHHQKLIVVDDAMAFCGGGDIAPDRWDTCEHLDDDPRRQKTAGKCYESRHETMSAVDGPAAAALGALFRERWERSAGDRPEPAPALAPGEEPARSLWPSCLPVTARNVRVGLSRTQPRWRTHGEVREAEALHLASIAAARRLIYMENQYFASPIMAEALAARLTERDGPEVVLVSTQHSPSWFDQMTMDRTRGLFLKRLKEADRYDRCRAFFPLTRKGRSIIVHSKLSVIDDDLVRIGSANLNNRSTGFDTECDLSVEAEEGPAGAAVREAIAAFRTNLVAHWLHVDPTAAAAAPGGLGARIERLDPEGRLMRPIEPKALSPFWTFIAAHHLGDPSGPADSWRPWRRRRELERQLRELSGRIAAAGLPAPVRELQPETV